MEERLDGKPLNHEFTPEETSRRMNDAGDQLDRIPKRRLGLDLGGSGTPRIRLGRPKNSPKPKNTG